MSDAEILVYMTQDAMPADQFLIERLLYGFSYENVAAVYARQLPAADCQFIERYTREFNYPKTSRLKSKEDLSKLGIKTYFCSNVCAAYQKDVYERLGGFVRKTIFNEDMILAGRMVQEGWKIYYAADAKVIHSHNYNCRQQFHRNFDLAVSQADHPEIFEGVPSEGVLGVSASSIVEAIQAQQDGADYLGVGAMFPTGTKTYADSVSMEELQKIRTAVSLPIVVIGGINKGNTGRFKPMGIDGLAVVSAIIAQSDIKAAAAELKDLFCGKEKKHGF